MVATGEPIWTGSRHGVKGGGISLDLSAVARLYGPRYHARKARRTSPQRCNALHRDLSGMVIALPVAYAV